MNYLVIYEESPQGFGAYCPELPGCVATASTQAECKRLIEEAVSLHICGLKEDGLPVPPPASKQGDILVSTHGDLFLIKEEDQSSLKKYLHR